jgi:hypothetical protein
MNVFKRLRNASDTITVSAAPPRSGWLARAKAATQGGVMLAAEATGAGLSVLATPLAAFTGRLYIAVLVAAFGLGGDLGFDGVEIHEPRFEDGLRHGFEGLIDAAVDSDLVIHLPEHCRSATLDIWAHPRDYQLGQV